MTAADWAWNTLAVVAAALLTYIALLETPL